MFDAITRRPSSRHRLHGAWATMRPSPDKPRHARRAATLCLLAMLGTSYAVADTVVIDFETRTDGDPVTTQYPGSTFSNATALTAGIWLNEFEFPPRSGTNVVFDDSGPITIEFLNPIVSFGGYFTYLEPLTLTAYDAGNNPIASASSLFNSNLALSGDPGSSPNELLQVVAAAGIREVIIAADPAGGSFVLDDATITTSTAVPEPSTRALFILAIVGMVGIRKIFKRKGSNELT